MSSSNRAAVLGLIVATVLSLVSLSCGGSSGPLKVSLSSATATVDVGATARFTATVANDSSGKGVNWTLSCATPPCGSVSPTSTPSAVATTYTPPATPSSSLTVTLSATSVSDATQSASVIITVPAVTISLSLTSVTLQIGSTSAFSATVANDGANGGVNWSVTCAQSACGSVAPTSTKSGDATTYTAPTAPPAGNLQVTLTATSVTDSSVVATATITVPGIVITLSPASASVQSGGTQQFSASITGDPNNAGVTWSLVIRTQFCFFRCGAITYVACTTCGAVAPSSSASGAAVMYTAPASFRPPNFRTFRGVFLQASSVTNTSAVGRAGITILPISVAVSPTSASVALAGNQPFTATVTNDGTNSGVTWKLTQNGSACSPGCGTISPTSSASGAAVTYTAPASAPPLPLLTVTATSVEDPTKSSSAAVTLTTSSGKLACGAGSGSESLLNGQYAFALTGSNSSGFAGIAGSITASGTGNITTGEEDLTASNATVSDVGINATGSAYAIGPDHRGCMILTNANGGTSAFRFALGSINGSSVATAGHILEFDDTTGAGTRLAGTLRLQDSTSFVVGQFKGSYTFGVLGIGFALGTANRFGMVGTFTADGVSALSSGTFDIDEFGTVTSDVSVSAAGSFTCCTTNGRGTLTLQAYNTPTLAFYVVSSSSAFLINDAAPMVVGELHAIPSSTSFTQSSLSGAAVLRETAQASAGPVVDLALASADGSSTLTTNDNVNTAGTFAASSMKFTYNVAASGRVTLTGISTPPVLYLYGPNQGYLLGTDANVTFGILDPQAAGPFSDASFSGAYMFGTEYPSAGTVTLQSGVLTANGTGSASGLSDQSNSAGLAQNQNLNLNYSIATDGTGNVGSGTTAIVISGNNLVFINDTDPNPTITVVEK